MLVAEFPPTTYAGLANYSYNIVKHLKESHNVEVLTPQTSFQCKPYISNSWHVCRGVRRVYELKKKERLDVVYAITFRPEFSLIGLYAKLVDIPIVSHGVGLDVYSAHPLYVRARKLAYSISEQLICGAVFQREIIAHEGAPRQNISVILGGVDTDVFRPMHDERYKARRSFNVDDKFVLLSLGRLVKRKGLDDALKALTYLGDIKDIILLIVGEGPEKPFLTRLTEELSLGQKVSFLDFLPASYLPAVYNIADLFIAPFKAIGRDMEGTPLVVQEAMSCGIPVVSTNSAGVPELVENGESGFAVNMNSPEEIAEKIRLLYENRKLRARMATEARQRAQELLDWRVTVAKTENVLKTTLRNRR